MASSSGTDLSGPLMIAGGIILIVAGVFARSIPILADQGSLTRPGLIIAGIVCLLMTAAPAIGAAFGKKDKKPTKRRGGY